MKILIRQPAGYSSMFSKLFYKTSKVQVCHVGSRVAKVGVTDLWKFQVNMELWSLWPVSH